MDRGWDLVSKGDFRGALVSAQRSLELDSDSPDAHNLMGYIHAAEGSPEEALQHYEQALELDDTFVDAMLNAAQVLIHSVGDPGAAIHLIDDALEYVDSTEEQADATLLKVDALLGQGKKAEAVRAVRQLPKGPFESPMMDFLVGRAFFEVGELDDSMALLQRALGRDPENPDARYYLGLLFERRGQQREASVELLRSRELDARLEAPPWALSAEQFEQLVQRAVHRLDGCYRDALDGALVIASDLPGPEVVADGVDPRVGALIDAVSPAEAPPSVGRIFVYQRNVERTVHSAGDREDEIVRQLERELRAAFPELAQEPKESPEPKTS